MYDTIREAANVHNKKNILDDKNILYICFCPRCVLDKRSVIKSSTPFVNISKSFCIFAG